MSNFTMPTFGSSLNQGHQEFHLMPQLSSPAGSFPSNGSMMGLPSLPSAPSITPLALSSFPDIKVSTPGNGFFLGVAKEFQKVELPDFKLPSEVKTIGTVYSAAKTADKLVKKIDLALEKGESKQEAVVCQTASTISQEIASKSLQGVVLGGLGSYVAEATVFPPLMLAAPFVANNLIPAYQGATLVGAAAGQVAETLCHASFDAIRELTKKGN